MEKLAWHKIVIDRNCREPSPRWGHTAVLIGDEIVCFGGYADSNYMNDLWGFNTITMAWTEYKTTGDIPSERSNCTVHFDHKSNSIILFGGGGPNKRRFNTVSRLNWATKQWSLIDPLSNEKGPWERTYHSSEIMYPYLIVFGGEGVSDLDDLWLFNLQTRIWTEVEMDREKRKPCARRFHTSVVFNNEFYVLAGCYSKYRCLNDVWKVNLTSLLQTGTTDQLEWEEIKLNRASFLTRWGHTAAVFDDKIYVFGGRFSNDLQDILIIDPGKETIKVLNHKEPPRARRRHSSVFVGSCMIIFGGFNGQYFNDLSYINLLDPKSKIQTSEASPENQLIKWIDREELSDGFIVSTIGKKLKIHKGLMISRFKSEEQLEQFLSFCQNRFTEEELKQMLEIIYLGAGKLPEQITEKFKLDIFDTMAQLNNHQRMKINPDQVELGSIVDRKRPDEVIYLNADKYSSYLERYHQRMYYDLLLAIGQRDFIPVNKTLLAVNSQYFAYLLRDHKQQTLSFQHLAQFGDGRVFQVLLNYLQSSILVVPEGLDEHCWMLLYHIAEYICLTPLMSQCEVQLIRLLCQKNCQKLLQYSSQHNLNCLSLHSGMFLFRRLSQQNRHQELSALKHKKQKTASQLVLLKLLTMVDFDLKQQEKRNERLGVQTIKRRSEDNVEKENEAEWMQE